MNEHPLYAVMRATPINAAARRAVRQGHCQYSEIDLSRDEMLDIYKRLERKLRLLKNILKIKSKAQHRNLVNAAKGDRRSSGFGRMKNDPRAASEYIRCGIEIQRISRSFQEVRKTRRGEAVVQNGWVAA